MALPTIITVIGKLLRADGTPSKGYVYFYSDVSVLYSGDESVMIPSYVRGVADPETGEFSADVPASNDPAWTPEGWAWRVVVNTPTFKDDFLTVIPYDAPGGEIRFSDLVPAEAGGLELYAAYNHTHEGIGEVAVTSVFGRTGDVIAVSGDYSKSDVGLANVDNTSDANKPVSTATQTALSGKAALVHTHEITDVNDLETQLSGLQPAGDYLVPDDITNLVSYETLQEELLGKSDTDHTHTVSTLTLPTYQPADHNLIGWTFDPILAFGTSVQPTSGLLQVARIRSLGPTITNIHFHLTAGGSVLTSGQCFAAIYSDAGALLGITSSLHSTGVNGWADGGFKTHPLTAPLSVTAGNWYKVVWWFNGTTGPTLSRAGNNGGAINNANLLAASARYATANTSITTAAPGTLGTQTIPTTAPAWWVGLS